MSSCFNESTVSHAGVTQVVIQTMLQEGAPSVPDLSFPGLSPHTLLHPTLMWPLCQGTPENQPARDGDSGSVPGMGGSPGEGNDSTLQYSCLENPTDRGDWWAAAQGVADLDTTRGYLF